MNIDNYNKKLRFIVKYGDLTTDGVLYHKYCVAFDEWYGEPMPWDALSESGYPEIDFREWVESRLLNIGDEDSEISVENLDEEIDRIMNARKD